ncbi:glutathione S-transferase family protein [Marinivivus vitaminiproducens]|uniref:glutathione S-transferase family protein n=1 Tax=Marinivivus vitaminiproducens TaxID=3035935 RepID=UPI00279B3669|nr:glutathione S-transferase family protein [Geminicoccaceae bacterium SCSIO 64248]
MKLYYAKHTCAQGIHILLEEIGKPYEAVRIDFGKQENYKEPFTRLSPKSKVPILELDDGQVLTEFGAIATYLALTSPEARLIPSDPLGHARMVEALDYAVGTIHTQGFGRLFRTARFSPREEDFDQVRATGKAMVEKGLAWVSEALGDKEYIVGGFSLADAALYYIENWAGEVDRKIGLAIPANVRAHFDRMTARPATRRALEMGDYNAETRM